MIKVHIQLQKRHAGVQPSQTYLVGGAGNLRSPARGVPLRRRAEPEPAQVERLKLRRVGKIALCSWGALLPYQGEMYGRASAASLECTVYPQT